MKKYFFAIILFVVLFSLFGVNLSVANADDFTDTVTNEINNLDLEELQDFLGNLEPDVSMFNNIEKMLKGEYSVDYSSVFDYLLKSFFSNLYIIIPDFFLIIAIILLNTIIGSTKGNTFSEEISNTLSFVFVISIISILIKDFLFIIRNSENTLNNLTKLTEIMSPIIATLMISQGEGVSASLFKPSVLFASGTFINIISSFVFPLIFLFITFSVVNGFSDKINFRGFCESVQSLIKWIIGIISAVFGILITVQSLVGTNFDSVSFKVSRYILSSSVPLIGGMVKDSVSLVAFGSLFIKNAIGITGIIAVFYIIIKPILINLAFSLLLKLTASFSEIYGENNVGTLLKSFSKSITYINICLIVSGICFFVIILFTVLSSGFYL